MSDFIEPTITRIIPAIIPTNGRKIKSSGNKNPPIDPIPELSREKTGAKVYTKKLIRIIRLIDEIFIPKERIFLFAIQTILTENKFMIDEKDNEVQEIEETEKGGLAEDISAVGQIIVGEIQSIGGMMKGDPITRAEGNFNADAGIIREEINEEIAETETVEDENEKA